MRATRMLFILVMSILLAFTGTAAPQFAAGVSSEGTVKTHDGDGEPDPVTLDDPKVCTFHIHALGFAENTTILWWVEQQPPTGTATVIASEPLPLATGSGRSTVRTLPDGHYKLYWRIAPEGTIKHKTFKVECGAPEGKASLSVFKYDDADANGAFGDETGLAGWTFSVAPAALSIQTVVPLTRTTGNDGYTDPLTLNPGTYQVCETQQAGWKTTDPASGACKTITLTAGQSATVRFGNTQIRALTLTSMCSVNPAVTREWRVRNPNPFAVPFTWEVYPNVQTGSGTAIANGDVFFTTNTIEGPNTTKIFWSGGQTVKASGGAQCTPTPSGQVRVFKYNDLDNDGSYDMPNGSAGEPGLSGWTFTIGPVVSIDSLVTTLSWTLTTGTGGNSEYLTLAPGTYRVCENTPLPTGWTITDPREGMCKNIELANGGSVTVRFGNHYTPFTPPVVAGTLQVTKYNDTDRDGQRDPAEPGLTGWSFQVRSGSSLLTTLVTGTTGSAAISLVPGTYTVTEVTQSGWTNTDPGGTTPTKTAVVVDGQVTGIIFGNAVVIIPPTTQTQLTIQKYSDKNANGARDTGEGGLAGFTFTVRSSDGAVVRTAVSGDDGSAILLGLPLGTYTITEEARTGWTNTDPGGDARKSVTLTSDVTSMTVVFGNAVVRLPSTATDDDAIGSILALALVAAAALTFVASRRRAFPI